MSQHNSGLDARGAPRDRDPTPSARGAAHRVCFTSGRINFTSLAGEAAAPVQGQALIASNGFFSRSKIYEEIATGRLKARKFGTRTGILDNDFRDRLATLPEMKPTKTGGAK